MPIGSSLRAIFYVPSSAEQLWKWCPVSNAFSAGLYTEQLIQKRAIMPVPKDSKKMLELSSAHNTHTSLSWLIDVTLPQAPGPFRSCWGVRIWGGQRWLLEWGRCAFQAGMVSHDKPWVVRAQTLPGDLKHQLCEEVRWQGQSTVMIFHQGSLTSNGQLKDGCYSIFSLKLGHTLFMWRNVFCWIRIPGTRNCDYR